MLQYHSKFHYIELGKSSKHISYLLFSMQLLNFYEFDNTSIERNKMNISGCNSIYS